MLWCGYSGPALCVNNNGDWYNSKNRSFNHRDTESTEEERRGGARSSVHLRGEGFGAVLIFLNGFLRALCASVVKIKLQN